MHCEIYNEIPVDLVLHYNEVLKGDWYTDIIKGNY